MKQFTILIFKFNQFGLEGTSGVKFASASQQNTRTDVNCTYKLVWRAVCL